ncbi:hypothetical protein JC221_093 [Yersinia phage JC221]|nr:hypothetical protein JC221_093 [Yersinia phage JC221]
MNSQFYVDAVKQSVVHNLTSFISRGEKGICIFETGLDLGRQSGKTKGAFDIIKKSEGTLNIYIGHSLQVAKDAACQNADTDLIRKGIGYYYKDLLILPKRSILDYFRGKSIEHQAVNIILDECDLSYNERCEIANTIALCMRSSNKHPYPFIHIIRLGM